MKDREETSRQILRDVAADFLAREAGPQSLITVTRTSFNADHSRATVYISVLPEDKETAALGLIHRNMGEFKDYVKNHTRLPRIPFIEFEIEKKMPEGLV